MHSFDQHMHRFLLGSRSPALYRHPLPCHPHNIRARSLLSDNNRLRQDFQLRLVRCHSLEPFGEDSAVFGERGGDCSRAVRAQVGGEARWIVAPHWEFFAGCARADRYHVEGAARWVAPDGDLFSAEAVEVAALGVSPHEKFFGGGQEATAAASRRDIRGLVPAGVRGVVLAGEGEERVAVGAGGRCGRGTGLLVGRSGFAVCRQLSRRRRDRDVAVDDPENSRRSGGESSNISGVASASLPVATAGGVEEGGASRG